MVKYQYKIVIPAAMSGHLTSLDTFTGKTNTHLLNLLANKQSIENTKISLINSDRVIAEKTGSLSKLQAGTDPLDIKAQEISVQQRENALADAREQLSNYFIRAPFNGVIAKVAVKKGDPVSSATVVATLVSKQQLAEISLNEVDVAKIKLGQKATLTFDAVPDLSLTGAVAEIDALGAVTQGVVSYNVKISFDTQDDRVKPGMSVSATIITQVKQNVLIVPASALKTQGTTRYVEIFDPALPRVAGGSQGSVSSATPPQPREVKVGASNDADAEIISGLKAGEQIVVRTIIPTTAAKPTGQTAPSLFGSGNGRGVGGAGAVRIPR